MTDYVSSSHCWLLVTTKVTLLQDNWFSIWPFRSYTNASIIEIKSIHLTADYHIFYLFSIIDFPRDLGFCIMCPKYHNMSWLTVPEWEFWIVLFNDPFICIHVNSILRSLPKHQCSKYFLSYSSKFNFCFHGVSRKEKMPQFWSF